METGFRHQNSHRGWKLILLASAAIPMSVSAQTSPTPQPDAQATSAATKQSDTGIGDIVVTAQRRAESLSRVPISISVANQQQLVTAGAVSTYDIQRVVPGLAVSTAVDGGLYFNPFIRGVGAGEASIGNDSSVAVYIDGVYQSDRSANALNLSDVDRIEVLKGPQGTLFGRNAAGGAISIITKTPSFDKLVADGEVSYARFNTWDAKVYASGPIADNLAASVSYEHRGGGDFVTNVNPLYAGKVGGNTSNAVDAKLVWRPSSRFELSGTFSYNHVNSSLVAATIPAPGTTPVGVAVGGFTPNLPYKTAESPTFSTIDSIRATIRARLSFNAFDVVSITGFVKNNDTQNEDYDATSANVQYFAGNTKTRDISQELQLTSTSSGRFTWTGGLYYFNGIPKWDPLKIYLGAPYPGADSDIINSPGGLRLDITAKQPTHSEAVYAQGSYDLGSGFKVTGGFRYSSETRKYSFAEGAIGQIAPGFFTPADIPLVSGNSPAKTFRKATFRAALEKQFSNQVLGYASFNTGFKSGVFNMNAFVPGLEPVKPENLTAYEVGAKGRFFDNSLQVNIAGFLYNYRNVQVTILTSDPSNPQFLQNAASEQMYGADIDFIYRPVKRLTLRGSASLLHSEYKKYPNAITYIKGPDGNGVLTDIDASGERGIFSPKWTFTFGADYNIDVGEGSIVLSGNYFRSAGYELTVASPIDRALETDNLGASATYYSPGKKYYVRAFGSNLTNRKVNGIHTGALATYLSYIEPISYGVAVGFHF